MRIFSGLILAFLLACMVTSLFVTQFVKSEIDFTEAIDSSVQGEVSGLSGFSGVASNGRSFGISTRISGMDEGYPVVAADDFGGVYVAWQSLYFYHHVFFAYSHDYGKTWSEDIRVDDDGSASVICDSPSIAVDQRTGHIYVVWKDNRTGSAKVYIDRSVDRGVSFRSDVHVSSYAFEVPCQQYTVNVEVGDDGKVYVAWMGARDSLSNSRDILFASSNDRGQTFCAPTRVNPQENNAYCSLPWIAVNREGIIYVAYSKQNSYIGDSSVYMARSLNEASSFEAPVKVNDDSKYGYRGKKEIAVSKSGRIHVVWTDARAGTGYGYWNIYAATSLDGGLSFGPNVRVNDDPFDSNSSRLCNTTQGSPSIAIDSDDGVHVVWEDFRNFIDYDVHYRDTYYAYSKSNTRFSENVRANYVPNATLVNCADPNIAIDAQDNLFIVWADSPYGRTEGLNIYFAFSPGWAWTKFHHDLGNTGFSTSRAPKTNSTRWNYATSGIIESSPAVADGKVFFGFTNGIHALNETTGDSIWNFSTDYPIKASPTVADGLIFVGSCDKNIYAINETTGCLVWNYTTGNAVLSSSAVVDGIVFVGSSDFNLYALNETTGQLIWNFTTQSSVELSPAIIDGLVFIGSGTNIYALNKTTGSVAWSQTYAVQSSPTVTDDLVLFGSDAGLYALNKTDGALAWQTPTGAPVYSSPAVGYCKVFFGCENHNIYALNETDGNILWNYTTNNVIRSSPAVADGLVFVGSGDNNVYALNVTQGRLVWKYTTEGEVCSSPAVAYGNLFVGSFDGKIYKFGPTHNIAVKSIKTSKTIIGEGLSMLINVTLETLGDITETCLLSMHYNELIDMVIVTLPPLTSTTVLVYWDTTGAEKDNYTIWAYALPILGETDVSDNNCTDGWFIVTIPGDVVEPLFEVDIYDITAICVCYDSKTGEPMYYPNCDVDGNGIIDIYDVSTACITYGQKYP